jgi:predicted nuclease with TOPRIM domain
MDENHVALRKARSLLIILMATCNQTLLALDAVGNVLDDDLTEDLRRMIGRTERELEALTAKLND